MQSYTYGGGGLSYTQSFSYDSLNRLSSATETNGGTTNWTQNNAYDRYGNRQIDYGGGSYNLAFSSTTNRITTSGFSYDSSGNLTNDTVHTYAFDGNDKILKVDSTTAYTYDGAGQRVRKLVGENTRFIYGIGGQLIAEYDGSSGNLKKEYVAGGGSLITIEPTAVNSNGAQYTASDHLGSPRVVTNSSGSVVSRHDYMPFGEELGSGTGGRTTGMGFSNSGDNNRKKFTGYERDTETGLDFAEARFYGNTQGRFTSPDPLAASAKSTDPQSWNRYAYVGNNPMVFSDPSGMSRGPAGMYSSIHDTDRPPGSRANTSILDEAQAEWEQRLVDTQAAIAEAEWLNEMAKTDPAGAAGLAANNSMLEVQTQNSETGADLATRAATGLSNHPGLLEQIQANTAAGVDVHIVACQAAKESNYAKLSQVPLAFKNGGAYISGAVGADGEIGLLQIFPSTGGTSANALKDVGTNVKAATNYLVGIKDHFSVDMRTALAIYNWGPGKFNNVDRDVNKIFSGSLSYADKILDCARQLYLPNDGNRYKIP